MKIVCVVLTAIFCVAATGCDNGFAAPVPPPTDTSVTTAAPAVTTDTSDTVSDDYNSATTQLSHEPPEYIDPPETDDIPELTQATTPPPPTAAPPTGTPPPSSSNNPPANVPTAAPAVTTAPAQPIWATKTCGIEYTSGGGYTTHKDELGYTVFDRPYPPAQNYSYTAVEKGDKFGGLTVISTMYADNGFMRHAQVHLNGTVTLTGYIKQYKAKADYSEAGDLEFYPDAAGYPLPIVSVDKTAPAPETQNNPDGAPELAFVTDTGFFRLGNISSLGPRGKELIPDDGSYARVTVTITSVTLADGVNGFYPCMGRITAITGA